MRTGRVNYDIHRANQFPACEKTNGKPAAHAVVEPIDEQDFDRHIGRCSHLNHHRETAPRPPSGSSGAGAWVGRAAGLR